MALLSLEEFLPLGLESCEIEHACVFFGAVENGALAGGLESSGFLVGLFLDDLST